MALDLDTYRADAEAFVTDIDREYYLQGAGHKPDLELEPIYRTHGGLFEQGAVAELRDALEAASGGDERRAARYLLAFALDGLMGLETRVQSEELARLEATLTVETDAGETPYRQVPVEMANEPDALRRAGLEAARDALLSEHMNPLYLEAMEAAHRICRELGWESYAAAYGDVRGIDLEALAGQTRRFLEGTEDSYAPIVDPRLQLADLPRLGELARSDLSRFFRAPELDVHFPAERLVASLSETLGSLGIDLAAQDNVHLDTEQRETKSPRAFCSPVRVPEEVYLVIAPVGGRDDYAALFHEAGHTEHYANVQAGLSFEFRHLGDNSVTESFAFLVEHLTDDETWLGDRLGVADPGEALAHARANKLFFIRRYAAKLGYELELHDARTGLEGMPDRYADLLQGATRVRWPAAAWLADVDPGFYAACYLRAWALETYWRRALRERWGERWYGEPEAGAWLRELWSQGQRLDADELLGEVLGEDLDFSVVAGEFRIG